MSVQKELTRLDNGKPVYLAAKGLKMRTKTAKVSVPEEALRQVNKGEARRIRKAARRSGRLDIARTVRHDKARRPVPDGE